MKTSTRQPRYEKGNYVITLENNVCLTYYNVKRELATERALRAGQGLLIKKIHKVG